MSKQQDQILKFMKRKGKPVTVFEIAEKMKLTEQKAQAKINSLSNRWNLVERCGLTTGKRKKVRVLWGIKKHKHIY